MPPDLSRAAARQIDASAGVFFALGNRTRLGLVSRLSGRGPQSIAKLSAGFPMSRQAITKHLRVLEEAGLVQAEARGRETIWQIEQRRLAEARRHLAAISAQWDAALGRLRQFVE